jgi:hypothetical protein
LGSGGGVRGWGQGVGLGGGVRVGSRVRARVEGNRALVVEEGCARGREAEDDGELAWLGLGVRVRVGVRVRLRARGDGVWGLEVRASSPPSGLHWTSWMGPSLLSVTLLTWGG